MVERKGGNINPQLRGNVQSYRGSDATSVRQDHQSSDVDSNYRAQHHTLGSGPTQAAAGNHDHRLIGLWLFNAANGTHTSPGNYMNKGWDKFKYWDKEYYERGADSSEVISRKAHTAYLNWKVTFDNNEVGARGVRWVTNGGVVQQTQEQLALGPTRPTRVFDVAIGIELAVGEVIKIEMFQNSGGNLTVNNGLFLSYLRIVRSHPNRYDVAGLTAGGINPQIPGPAIASRQFFGTEGSW